MAHRVRGQHLHLKRRYGLDRTLFDTTPGAQTWCGLGVLAHNTVKTAVLIQAKQLPAAATARGTRPRELVRMHAVTFSLGQHVVGPAWSAPRSR